MEVVGGREVSVTRSSAKKARNLAQHSNVIANKKVLHKSRDQPPLWLFRKSSLKKSACSRDNTFWELLTYWDLENKHGTCNSLSPVSYQTGEFRKQTTTTPTATLHTLAVRHREKENWDVEIVKVNATTDHQVTLLQQQRQQQLLLPTVVWWRLRWRRVAVEREEYHSVAARRWATTSDVLPFSPPSPSRSPAKSGKRKRS